MPRNPRLEIALLTLTMAACAGADRADARGSDAPQAQAAAHASTLDQAIAAHWRAAGVEPAPVSTDAEFVRRVTLDLVGRIPTAAETTAFLRDRSKDKRAARVDTLLRSDAYAEHWADVYTDVLLGKAPRVRKDIRAHTHTWLSASFAAGERYDSIAHELLTAQGPADRPGPHGFFVAHGAKNRVEAVTAESARIFLGLRLDCAQCHDHPTDPRYTQRDFYALAAYFAQTRVRRLAPRTGMPGFRVVERGRGEMQMPTAEDASGDRTGPRVAPRFLGADLRPEAGQTRREVLADAVIGSSLFAKAAVNRTWGRLFGRALVEPLDDLGAEDDPRHPPLLNMLAAQFAGSDYDFEALLRAIVLSRAYDRTSAGDTQRTKARTAAFAQAAVRPMSADQLFRSLLVATGVERTAGGRLRAVLQRRKERALREYRFVFADDEMGQADGFTGSVPQALLLLNGELTNRGVVAKGGSTLAEILDDSEDPAQRIEALYLAVYSRRPSPDERRARVAFVEQEGNRRVVYEDLMHAMLVSGEFSTTH